MTASEGGILNQSLVCISLVQMKTLREKITQMLAVRLNAAAIFGSLCCQGSGKPDP